MEKEGGNIRLEGGSAFVRINPELFSVEAVLTAAYTLTDKAYLVVDGDIDRELCVEVRPKGKEKPGELALELCNELVSAQVYLMESQKKSKITEAIIGEAMAGLEQPEEEEDGEG